MPGKAALTPDAQRHLDGAIPKIGDFNPATVGLSILASSPARVTAVAEDLHNHGVLHRVGAARGNRAKSTNEAVVTLVRLEP